MAVAVVLEFEGATLDQYDQVVEKMGLRPQGSGPAGSVSHWVTATDSGIRVTDVWESREVFDRFSEDQIQPLSAEVGMPGPSQVSIYEVHNYFTPA